MKTKNIVTFAVLGLLGLSACSSEEELKTDWQDDSQVVKFDAFIQQMSQARTNPSDDSNSTKFNQGDQISISAGQQKSTYQYGTDKWAPTEGQRPIIWIPNTENMTFNAQYPAGDVTNGFNVPTDQSDATKIASADYMTCSVTSAKSTDPVQLQMQRQMARVRVTGITYRGMTNPTISAITFSSKSVVGGSGTSSSFVDVTPLVVGSGYMALLAPVSKTDGQAFIKVTVNYQDNGEQTKTFTVKNTPALVAGYKYEFSLKVGYDNVEMDEVSVSPWNEIPGGDLETNTDLEPVVDAGAHKVTLKEAGTLDAFYLHEAYGSRSTGNLAVEGPANETDLQVIAEFCKAEDKSVNLNLNNLTGFNSLPANSFKDCTALTQITLPASITAIYDKALANTGLTEFNIPSTVTTIGKEILSGCSNLIKVNLLFNKETAGVTYTYDANALQGVGTAGKEVTLNLHYTWKEGLLSGDASNGYTFLGGKFKTVQELTKTSAVRFNDAGICIEKNEFLNNNKVKSVTYEALVNFNSFTPTTNRNNTIMGTEGKLLLRVGDAGNIGDNITQLVMQNERNETVNNKYGFETYTWYHLAMTYNATDGETCIYINGTKVAGKMSTKGKSFDLKFTSNHAKECVSIGRFADFGRDGNRPLDGMMREVRIWNVARTAEEIRANMMSVGPKTTGLKVYYKLDGTDISQDGKTVTNQATDLADGTIQNGEGGSLTKVEVEPIVIP